MIFKKAIVLSVFLFFFFSSSVWARENNKFGIHILETEEVEKAAELVNSSGGDWGYVTIVLRDDDFNKDKWQKFFNDCRRLHVIPIIRLATHMTTTGVWDKPDLDNLQKWSDFLADLNWPVKQQTVAIFNEPNHAKEWGGEINPSEYAMVLTKMIKLFKSKDNNFFILPAGLDQAADGNNGTLKEESFLEIMHKTNVNIFNELDGWNSHSYPNHGFIGLPEDRGRATINGYEWEQEKLISLGLTKNLPIYITETGWPHREGVVVAPNLYNEEQVSRLMQEAFTIWNQDEKVLSVTPFVLNYPQELFMAFSWLDDQGRPYPQYELVKSMPKSSWWPEQINRYQVKAVSLPSFLPANTTYEGKIVLKNIGQSICGDKEPLKVPVQASGGLVVSGLVLGSQDTIEPGETEEIRFTIKSLDTPGEYQFAWGELPPQQIEVFPASFVYQARYNLWERLMIKVKEAFL